MKFAGALLIVVSCAMLGYEMYVRSLKKLKFTDGLISGFEFCKSEISFSQEKLSDIFIKCAPFAGEVNAFFYAVGNELNNEGVALDTVFESKAGMLRPFVSNEVFEIVKDTVLQLGLNDIDSQVQLIGNTIEKLNNCRLKQSAFCDKEGIMCKKIGVVAGVGISLLLF